MKIWEIVADVESLTALSDDFRAVVAATLIIGGGMYGAREVGGNLTLPSIRYWTSAGVEKWLTDMFPGLTLETDRGLEDFIRQIDKRATASVLRTVQVCSPKERLAYQKALEMIKDGGAKQEYARWFKEQRRTSALDVTLVAWHIADKLDAQAAAEERELQGVSL